MDVLTGRHSVAAVVPAWNEVTAIPSVVAGLHRAGACCVYVVDAGSTDGTVDAARAAGATVVTEHRRGYGRACMSGAAVAAAGHDLLAFLDGDGSCDPADLLRLVATAREHGADLVLGARLAPEPGAMGWHARAGNRLVAALVAQRSGRALTDLTPIKLVRRQALAALALDDTGYGWTVQLTARALTHPALRSIEVPVGFRPRMGGRSKVSGRLGPSARAAVAMLRQGWVSSRRRGIAVLMAKAPRVGHSKTRLAAGLGGAAAEAFGRACLVAAGDLLRETAARARIDVAAIAPSPEDARVVARLTGLPVLVQSAPGLGAALWEVSELPAPFTIALSADVPGLDSSVLVEAASRLARSRAVLGPGEDGGYYLVGLRRGVGRNARRRAFLGAPLGGDRVLEHARAALGPAQMLRPLRDIDTAADVAHLLHGPAVASLHPALREWLAAGRESDHLGRAADAGG